MLGQPFQLSLDKKSTSLFMEPRCSWIVYDWCISTQLCSGSGTDGQWKSRDSRFYDHFPISISTRILYATIQLVSTSQSLVINRRFVTFCGTLAPATALFRTTRSMLYWAPAHSVGGLRIQLTVSGSPSTTKSLAKNLPY